MKYYDTADEVLQRAATISLLLLDVDGVLTNGQLYYGEHGEVMKAFNTLDGQGIKLLQQNGIRVGIISGRKSAALSLRAAALGITLIAQGREDKAVALDELLQDHPCPLDRIAYIGDDLPDLLVMRHIGLPIAVPNAHDSVHHCAALCTTRAGGDGAVRDVADFLLRAQGKYEDALRAFL
ncbi:KdsC family phosphatase [Pseudohongiella sp.]|uniref:3-deoxy-D-manno-octulosonate 8-phosphate phosphatase KdsC n=1 Tax=marine sediment metagenome TaxID=412755 RepID=A0A0F9VZ79_9ZZZZ|nr:HAD-IIIA family hydrolase [Pseudohongiella sp.]HDZ10452.1 HAD-IIIA family hydrolase [Pseudohongiella sp.]HEA62211.1 HAD-IIIA family hydrolase [Pseudohongiella sp.]